jgi:hypothetical protein
MEITQPASVCANPIMYVTPSAASAWRARAGGETAPPVMIRRSEQTSHLARSGWPSREQHGGHAAEQGDPVRLDELELKGGGEAGHEHVGGGGLNRAEGEQRAAAHMEHRHRVDLDVVGPDAGCFEGQPRVVGETPVGEHRPLGHAGGARGVKDHRRARRGDVRQRACRCRAGIAERGERVPFAERHHVAEPGQAAADLGEDGVHVPLLKPAGEEEAVRRGVPEDVRELVPLVGRVDRDQGQPGERGAELENDPLGAVRRPHRDPLAGREPGEQRPRGPLGLGKQLGVGPLAAALAVRVAVDQRGLVRGAPGGIAQDRADRGLADPGDGFAGGPVGVGERSGGR